MAMVTVRYWAAARQAAGVTEEKVTAATLAEALSAVLARREEGSELPTVMERSSFLVDGKQVGRRGLENAPLPEGAVIEVLPPFAGG